MNKAKLADTLAEKTGLTRKQTEQIIDTMVEVIQDTLSAGEEVTIAGFGTFMAKFRSSRMGVNPQNPTERIQIPAVTIPKFKAGKGLKDALKAAPAQSVVAGPEQTPSV